MKWLDRLRGKPTPGTEREQDERALEDLRTAFDNVHDRTERLERELLRVNAEMRQRMR